MEHNQLLDCIDIRLVKEQLRLLGHEVADDVILSFVKGLAGGGAEQQCLNESAAAGPDAEHPAAGATSQGQRPPVASSSCKHATERSSSSKIQATGRTASSAAFKLLHAGSAAAAPAPAQQVLTDAPCRSQLADQQSPKRALLDFGSTAAVPQVGLDQRCRKFLVRLTDRQSAQQQQQQLVSPGARSRASLTELSDSASDGDQEQASHSPLSRRKGFAALDSTAGAASAHNTTGGDAGTDVQHLVGAIGALDIQQNPAQQSQIGSGGSSIGRSHQPQEPGLPRSVLDAGSDVVFEVPPSTSSDSRLPRFGFRPGYRPVGIHMPPPPGHEALALMQQTNSSRSSRAGSTGAVAGRSAPEAAACAPLEGGNPASSLLLSEQQQQQALQQLAAKVQHHAALARAAPGLRASSESIISEATPGGGSSCHDARPRRVSKDGSGPTDPLYHAPASPTGGAGGSCSSRPAGSGRSPAADAARAPAAGSSRPRSLVFEHLTVVSSSAGNQQVALPGRQLCSSRAPTTSSRGSVAPTTAGSSSYSGVRSNGGNSSSLSRYCQQLSWSSGRSTAVAPGVCKTDRVARFQKMQQAWQKDRYLNTGASRKGAGGSSRPAAVLPVRSKPSWED